MAHHRYHRTPEHKIKQKKRTDANREYKKAHPYVAKKRSPEKTALKLAEKEIKRQRYIKRSAVLRKLEQK